MKDTKARILDHGLNLLSQTSFGDVTVGMLAQRAGMSKSGLFAHFGSKEEVQLNLIEQTSSLAAATVTQPAMAHPPGLERLRAFMNDWLGWTERAGLDGGCPIAAGFFEYDDAPTENPIRQRLLHEETRWRAVLTELIDDAVGTGEIRADVDSEQLAWELCGIYLNHHVSRRFMRDPNAGSRAKNAVEALILRSMPCSKPTVRKRREVSAPPLKKEIL